MVTIDDKLNLIMDVNKLLNLQDEAAKDIIYSDIHKIDMTYKRMFKIFRYNLNIKFTHILTGETMTLCNWADYRKIDLHNPKSIVVFLRYIVYALKLKV